MEPTGSDHMNGWREPGRFEDGSRRREPEPNRWSDAAAIGDQVEGWLSDLSHTRRVVLADLEFLGSADAQLPGTGTNNWREPLDEHVGTASA
jgi:hypothetical protein